MALPANLCFQTAGCQQSCSYQSLCLKQTETEKKILNLETWSYFKYIILVTQIYKLQSHLYKSESSQSILPFQFLVSSTHFIYVRQDFVDVLHTAPAPQQVSRWQRPHGVTIPPFGPSQHLMFISGSIFILDRLKSVHSDF